MSPEQSPRPLDQAEEVLVRALGQVTMALPHEGDADMARDGGLRLPEYARRALPEASKTAVRMSELADACNLAHPRSTTRRPISRGPRPMAFPGRAWRRLSAAATA
ncbi:hypothetical protein [Streptomyces sp. NPDC002133]|uniref:hypothetical protein n=1 Tax=Streptomyces sp. NPDC002133 TaxID=3154409 RepID=UPI0033257692